MYRSYRRLLSKWKKLPEKKRKRVSPPSLPTIELLNSTLILTGLREGMDS